ncbi:SMP-30/gluconolactonase/LRE family protein [Streptomyces sp. SP18CS02]|uniref:SMP-30/gluconolactonase/LRE family protein n=1 Tax=Streptomyces sp. SP18CS02 TaxID=3002531 RepID=UPI002E78F249|nr:SMP-30/gluconolactonase/LRE family protein [Streptomyces sp. SP18CS02]MEE1754470.1 SMP-30/gluconolactonase/LRE family protein [Streptomyces sp. SP18CS02]
MQLTAVPCAPEPGRLTEGPVWHAGRAELLWVDITAGLIHRAPLVARDDDSGLPDLGRRVTLSLDRPVGAIAPCASGGLLAAAGTAFLRVDDRGGQSEFAAPVLPDDGTPRRMNDAKCDPQGRLLAGTMAYDVTPGAGALYRLDPGGAVVTLLDSVTISNGLGWSPDGRLMYYADSPTRRVDVFDHDPVTGALSARRPFAGTGPTGEPDGLSVDTEGRVWVAVWGAGQVRAYTPDGALHAVVTVPASQVSSCAFAGPDLDVLVITTASEGLSPEQLAKEPLAGRIFVCRPGATGLPIPSFADDPAHPPTPSFAPHDLRGSLS